jgi:hypothetical protein
VPEPETRTCSPAQGGEDEASTAQVAAFLEEREVSVIDLSPKLAGRDLSSLVVNSADHHPNERVHAEVAGYLHEAVLALGAP